MKTMINSAYGYMGAGRMALFADRAAAERALNARRIIEFPTEDSGERHVIQDERGFWRIVPGLAPPKLNEFFDAL